MKKHTPPPMIALYAHRCSVTGEGLNTGWTFDPDQKTWVKYEADVIHELRTGDYFTDALKPADERTDDELLFDAQDLGYLWWVGHTPPSVHDKAYTLNGMLLEEEWQRRAYLDRLPCTPTEVAACLLTAMGHMTWVVDELDHGEGPDDKAVWKSTQALGIGVWNVKLDENDGIRVHDQDIQEYCDMWKSGLSDELAAQYDRFSRQPDQWRFIGWEETFKEHGPKHAPTTATLPK